MPKNQRSLKRYARQAFAAIALALLLCAPLPANASPPIYLKLTDITRGLSPQETKDLQQKLKSLAPYNLENSGFPQLHAWLEALNQRLTDASEKIGSQFGLYRIFLAPTEKDYAHVYKYRPPGHQFYRGFVFLSTRLLQTFSRTLNKSPQDMTDAELEVFLGGVVGVALHEFAHPKQDELVKWEIRSDQEKTRSDHDQFDELSTDFLSISLAREAGLPRESILTGLELLYDFQAGRAPLTRRQKWIRGAKAALSVHPYDKLRVGMVEAAVFDDEIRYGTREIRPLPYDPTAMKAELQRLTTSYRLAFTDHPNRIVALLDGCREMVVGSERRATFEAYLTRLQAMLAEGQSQDPELEATSLRELVLKLYHEPYSVLAEETFPTAGDEMRYELEFGGRIALPHIERVRNRQKVLAQIPLFDHPSFLASLEKQMQENPGFFIQGVDEDGNDTEGGLVLLSSIFPMPLATRIYEAYFARLGDFPPLERGRHLIEMLYGNIAGGGPVEFDHRILAQLGELVKRDRKLQAAVGEVLGTILVMPLQYFQGRLIAFGKANPGRPNALLREYAKLLRRLLANPQSNLPAFSESYRERDSYDAIAEILLWDKRPETFLQRFAASHPVPTSEVADYFLELLRSPAWEKEAAQHHKAIADKSERGTYNIYRGAIPRMVGFLVNKDSAPFTREERAGIQQQMVSPSVLMKLSIALGSFEDTNLRLALIQKRYNGQAQLEAAAQWYAELKPAGPEGFFQHLQTIYDGTIDPITVLFENSEDQFIDFLKLLHSRALISEQEKAETILKYVVSADTDEPGYHLTGLLDSSTFEVWRASRLAGKTGLAFLESVLRSFQAGPLAEVEDQRNRDTRHKHLANNAAAVGAAYSTHYFKLVATLAAPMRRDFLEYLGSQPSDADYAQRFNASFDRALKFYQLLFNPDGTDIPMHMKGFYETSRLDDLTPVFTALIPDGLSERQYYLLWKALSTKRANLHTDALFESHVAPWLSSLPPSERLSHVQGMLDHGLLGSERLKTQQTEFFLQSRIAELASRTAPASDKEIYELVSQIQYFCPNASRFRDDLAESLAWKLNLRERQLVKFIEPMKTSNYAAIDTRALNVLSALTVLSEEMPPKDQLNFIDYIQNPQGSLTAAVPTVAAWLRAVQDEGGNFHRTQRQEALQRMESFIRDAGDIERQIMVHVFVGTRTTGLWHQGDEMREELFRRLHLDDAPDHRALLETHLRARKEYQHPFLISYLLSLRRENAPFDLVRLLEQFRAPGVKFAQISSILDIFGPENRERLGKAKDGAMVPSKAKAFEMLRSVLSSAEYEQVEDIEAILGSGSIKVVLRVRFKNGDVESVSVKRPHVEETNELNMDLADAWVTHLQALPQYAGKYDYTYLLQLLRDQLKMDTDFRQEFLNTTQMQKHYTRRPAVRGWAFAELKATARTQSENVMHFQAISEAVHFQKLAAPDRAAAAELILDAELDLLLNHGLFDAERTTGNYLFVPGPGGGKIYAIDMPQVYRMRHGSFFSTDDRSHLAAIMEALARGADGAAPILENALRLSGVAPDEKQSAEVLAELQAVLASAPGTSNPARELGDKMVRTIGALHRHGIHLPNHFSLGLVKALTILTGEDYAKEAPAGFIEQRVRRFVGRQKARSALVSGNLPTIATTLFRLCSQALLAPRPTRPFGRSGESEN